MSKQPRWLLPTDHNEPTTTHQPTTQPQPTNQPTNQPQPQPQPLPHHRKNVTRWLTSNFPGLNAIDLAERPWWSVTFWSAPAWYQVAIPNDPNGCLLMKKRWDCILCVYHIILYRTISYYTILFSIILLYLYIVSYHSTLYYIILYYIILYCIILYHIILYYIISYHNLRSSILDRFLSHDAWQWRLYTLVSFVFPIEKCGLDFALLCLPEGNKGTWIKQGKRQRQIQSDLFIPGYVGGHVGKTVQRVT